MTVDTLRFLLPEIILILAAIIVVVVDLVNGRRTNDRTLAAIAVAGLLAAALAAFTLTGLDPTSVTGTVAIDGFAVFLKVVALVGVALVVLLSVEYLPKHSDNRGEYYAFLLAVGLAISVAVGANDLILIYIALEFLSITSYILVGYLRNDAKSSEASVKYFIYGSVASGVLLYGLSLLFGATGSTNLLAVFEALSGQGLSEGMRWLSFTSVALLIVGFGFKISLVPFHQWAPDTYEGAPTPITGFLSTASKAAGFALLVRTFVVGLTVFAIDWITLLAGLSMVTMTFGNLVALRQTNMKRLFAYSSIAQAGYILMGLVAIPQVKFGLMPFSEFTFNGINGILIYLFSYLFTNLGVFAVVIAVENRTGKVELKDYAGLFYRSPWLASLLLLFLLSLTGIPPTLGFWAKYFVFGAAIHVKFYALAFVGLINAAIAAGYYLNIARYMFMMDPQEKEKISISPILGVALAVCALVVVVIGIQPRWLIEWASESATFLTSM